VNAWKRWHAIFGAFAFAVPLFVYIRTLTVTVPFWDSGEFIATSFILGLPHPPGNPVYTMLGRMMTLIPIASVAQRVNFMSALSSAIACYFTYLVVVRALRRTFEERLDQGVNWIACLVGGLSAALFIAFASSFWDSAIEAEVYSMSSALIAFCMWLAFRWWDRLDQPGNDKLLVLIAYVLAVSTGVHLGTILVGPGLLLLLGLIRPSYFKSGAFWAATLLLGALLAVLGIGEASGWSPSPLVLVLLIGGVTAFLLSRRDKLVRNNLATWWALATLVGFTVQLFLLLRSQDMPAINEGAPTTFAAWKDYLLRKQYGPSNPFDRRADLWYQISHMFLRYIGEQWKILDKIGSLDLQSFWVRLVNMLPFALAFLGAWWNAQRDKKTFWFFLSQNIVMGPALVFYLNFTDHEVRERDYFFTNSYHFIAIWIGMGAAALLHAVSEAIHPQEAARAEPSAATAAPGAPASLGVDTGPSGQLPRVPSVAWITALALIGFSALPARAGWYEHDRSNFWIAHDYAYNMLAPLAPNSIVMTNGDNDTFPLWYIQEVEHFRKDVRVVNMSLLNTPWYILELKNLEPKVPFSFTDAQVEKLYPYLDEKTGQVVWVKDVAVRDMIATNAYKRPVYLAVTVPDQMGLEKQMTLEGLVYRIQAKPGAPELDLDKIVRNLYSVFKFRGLLDSKRNFDTSVYKDENAMRLVQNYSAAHVQIAYQLQTMNHLPQAIKVLEDARKISPDFPGLLEYLGRLHDQNGEPDKAEAFYREGMRRFPDAPEFYFHLGTMAYRRGAVDESVRLLRRATELSQQYFDWFSALFTVLWQTGQREEAIEVLRTWLRAHPEDQQTATEIQRFEDSLRTAPKRLADELRPSGGTKRGGH
jgi:hypothetical protein